MTHGKLKTLQSYDEEYNLDELSSHFTDENCPSFKGKPRVFLIQACRHDPVNASSNATAEAPSIFTADSISKHSRLQLETLEENDSVACGFGKRLLPNFKDFLFVHSTMEGFYSFRAPKEGAWFIQALCAVLEENGTKFDFVTLLTLVNDKLSDRESDCFRQLNQTSSFKSMLTKILKFNASNRERVQDDPESLD